MLSEYGGKTVLITGGLGFIGSNLALHLVNAGARVIVVDAIIQGCGANPFNLAPFRGNVQMIVSDIGDTDRLAQLLPRVDIVFNVAGEISHSRSMKDPGRDLELNTVAQLRFLLACREHCPGARVVYACTRQVYGQHEHLPVAECHPINPVDFNGIHKDAASKYHLLLSRHGHLDCIVLRLSNVYGPRMALHLPHQGFLGVYFRMALEGKPLLIYGDGNQLRDPAHVDDIVDAFLRAGVARQPQHRVFNIGGLQTVSIQEIARTMAAAPGCLSSVRHMPFPHELKATEIGSYFTDTRRAERELGWIPKISFAEGVSGTLAFFREHRQQYLGSNVLSRSSDFVDELAVDTVGEDLARTASSVS